MNTIILPHGILLLVPHISTLISMLGELYAHTEDYSTLSCHVHTCRTTTRMFHKWRSVIKIIVVNSCFFVANKVVVLTMFSVVMSEPWFQITAVVPISFSVVRKLSSLPTFLSYLISFALVLLETASENSLPLCKLVDNAQKFNFIDYVFLNIVNFSKMVSKSY